MKTSTLNLRTVILAALTLIMSVGSTFATPSGNTEKSTSRLMDQVIGMVENPTFEEDLDGKAVITFRVNEDSKIEIVEVFSDNQLLVKQIKTSLDGKQVEGYDMEFGQKIRFNMTYNDPR